MHVVVVVVVGGGFGALVVVVVAVVVVVGGARGAVVVVVVGGARGAVVVVVVSGAGPVAGGGPVVGVAGAATDVTAAVAGVVPPCRVGGGDPTVVWCGGTVVDAAGALADAAGALAALAGVVAAAVVGPDVVVTFGSCTLWVGSLGRGPPGATMTSTASTSPTTASPANMPARWERARGPDAGSANSSWTRCSAVAPSGSVPTPSSSIGSPFLCTGDARCLHPGKRPATWKLAVRPGRPANEPIGRARPPHTAIGGPRPR